MLDSWIDIAHGGRCVCCGHPGRVLCRPCAGALPGTGRPMGPDPAPPGLVPTYAAGWYDDPLRPLLLAHKERRAFSLARPLGEVLGGVVATALGGATARVVLVPVPSRSVVVRSRGHDPVRRMVRAGAVALGDRGHQAVLAPLLRQRGAVRDQAGLDVRERAANLSGLLAVDPHVQRRFARAVGPALVVLCDDVITTGATAREAQRALEEVGIGVALVAVVAATRKRLRGVGSA